MTHAPELAGQTVVVIGGATDSAGLDQFFAGLQGPIDHLYAAAA